MRMNLITAALVALAAMAIWEALAWALLGGPSWYLAWFIG